MGKTIVSFIKNWILVIAMATGAAAYLIYHQIPALHPAGPVLERICLTLQPLLLFAMLFLSFCKIEPHQLKPHRWQFILLGIQTLMFLLFAVLVYLRPEGDLWRIPLEAAMLVLICPTANACAVVTGKLGGDMAGVVTYTVLINLLVAVAMPAVIPFIHPIEGLPFNLAFNHFLVKVFPLLILPCLCAWLIRYVFPRLHRRILHHVGLSFYLWAFCLSLAILMCTRSIVHSPAPGATLGILAAVALLVCIFNFGTGRLVGSFFKCTVSAGQALGQKNTILVIWMAYTFMDPVSSVVGGFYSIWQNIFNSWQLSRKNQ